MVTLLRTVMGKKDHVQKNIDSVSTEMEILRKTQKEVLKNKNTET
jgi:hypothetical protein